MEYLRFRGEYADVPIDEIAEDFNKHYAYADAMIKDADFDADVEREVNK